jgi:23S rRNA U2552 (ribose-2'-O)-methylase RlmE/FtsJ
VVAAVDGTTDASSSSSSSSSAAAAAAVCRAFYKLQEAVQIAGVDERFVFKGAMAIDAGAAPGGWTKYLALDRGCEKVKTQPNTCLPTIFLVSVQIDADVSRPVWVG